MGGSGGSGGSGAAGTGSQAGAGAGSQAGTGASASDFQCCVLAAYCDLCFCGETERTIIESANQEACEAYLDEDTYSCNAGTEEDAIAVCASGPPEDVADCNDPSQCSDGPTCTNEASCISAGYDRCIDGRCWHQCDDNDASSTPVKTTSKPPTADIIIARLLDIDGPEQDGVPDGVIDANDQVDRDGDGYYDDFDENGAPDNRFVLDGTSIWVPDSDSYDDYTGDDGLTPRGTVPFVSNCPKDGIETGPPDLPGFEAGYLPSSYCFRTSTNADGATCIIDPRQRSDAP